jgi:hypothetical protein
LVLAMPRPNDKSIIRSIQMKYDIANYDENLCLRVSPVMWLAMLFLIRAYLITVLSVINFRDPLALINLLHTDAAHLALGAVAGVPVLAVLYALRQRKPGASARVQWIWRNGRSLLAISAVLSVVVTLVPILTVMSHRVQYAEQAQVVLSAAVLLFVLTSKRVADTFAEFPGSAERRAGV